MAVHPLTNLMRSCDPDTVCSDLAVPSQYRDIVMMRTMPIGSRAWGDYFLAIT